MVEWVQDEGAGVREAQSRNEVHKRKLSATTKDCHVFLRLNGKQMQSLLPLTRSKAGRLASQVLFLALCSN